jgi:hypothetical protein
MTCKRVCTSQTDEPLQDKRQRVPSFNLLELLATKRVNATILSYLLLAVTGRRFIGFYRLKDTEYYDDAFEEVRWMHRVIVSPQLKEYRYTLDVWFGNVSEVCRIFAGLAGVRSFTYLVPDTYRLDDINVLLPQSEERVDPWHADFVRDHAAVRKKAALKCKQYVERFENGSETPFENWSPPQGVFLKTSSTGHEDAKQFLEKIYMPHSEGLYLAKFGLGHLLERGFPCIELVLDQHMNLGYPRYATIGF